MKAKKAISLFLALVMALSCMSMSAWATTVDASDDDTAKSSGAVASATPTGGETTYYTSLMEAINAAYNGGTVELLQNVTVNNWHQNVWSTEDRGDLTYGGNRAVTGCNGLTIDGNGNTLTVNSIDSGNNGNQLFYGSRNLTVKNLTINVASGVNGIGLKSGLIENVTFNMAGNNPAIYTSGSTGNADGEHIEIKGCTFNTEVADSYAIYSCDPGNGVDVGTIISGNTFNTRRSIALRSDMQFLNNVVNGDKGVTVASGSTAVVRGNYFADTTTSRSINIYPAPEALIEGNVILGPIELEDMEYTAAPNLSKNYWANGAAPVGLPEGVTYSSYYTVASNLPTNDSVGANFTLDGLVNVGGETKVAQIGDNKYDTLADAIAAVPTTGVETTITMIADETMASNATLTIPATKNIVLDLNGKTITGSNDSKSVYFLTNNGTLEITDTSDLANGKITFQAVPDTGYSVENVTIYNLGGTLKLSGGTVENTTPGGLTYAINNSSNAWGESVVSTFNMTGGTISAPNGDATLRVYQNTGVSWKVYSKNYVNISDGTIRDNGIFVDTTLYTTGQDLTGYDNDDISHNCVIDTRVNISGGTINGLIDMKLRHPYSTSLNITGGDFTNSKLWVRKVANEYGKDLKEGSPVLAEPTDSVVTISGGKWSFVTGKAFGLAYDCGATSWTSYDKPYYVSGGVFNVDLNSFDAIEFPTGKTGVENTDSETITAYPYTVGVEAATESGAVRVYDGELFVSGHATLDEALNAAVTGNTVKLFDNANVDKAIMISKSITLDGNNHTITTTANRGIRIDTDNVNVTVKNLTITGGSNFERAIQVDSYKDNVTLTINNVTATATYYTVNICGGVDNLTLNVVDSNITGWAAINLYGSGLNVNIEDSVLTGNNDKSFGSSNSFGVIVLEGDTTYQTTDHSSDYVVTIRNTTIKATSPSTNTQYALLHNAQSENNVLTLDSCTFDLGENCLLFRDNSTGSVTKVKPAVNAELPTLNAPYSYSPVDANGYYTINGPVAYVGNLSGNSLKVVGSYATLQDAIDAATDGQLIYMLGNVDLTATQVINKNLTIYLNGNNITATDARALWIKSGEVLITGSGTISANGENLGASSSVIRVGDSAANANAASLTIGESVTVSSAKCYGVTAFGVNNTDNDLTTPDITLVIDGTVAVTGTASAVSGNGTDTLSATTMTINGTVSATQDYAIYHPGKGTLTVSGTVTGLGGIEAKGGTVTINSTATVTATASEQTHSAYDNGASTSGYAIAAVSNPNYTGEPIVAINGATINGKAIFVADYNVKNSGIVTATNNMIATESGYGWTAISDGYQLVELSAIAQIGETKYTDLQTAFDAAQSGQTIVLIADATMNERVFVNAGAKTLDTGSRYATTSDTRSITLDLNGHEISGTSNIALAGGSLNVTGTGTISTSTGGLAPIEVRGTGDLTAKRTLTIGENVTLTGSTYGLNIFGSNDAQANKIDVTVNGTVKGQLFVLGNLTNTSNAINIVVNDSAKLDSIAENGYANVTINGGSFTEDTDSCVEVRAGTLTINGGTFTNTAASFSCTSNGSGTTTKGAAIAIAQHTTVTPINVIINDGTFTGPCALSIANPQLNATNNVTVSVTGGYFKGTTSTVAQTVKNDDNRVTGFISGGIFYDDAVNSGDPSIKGTGYVASGYEAVLLTSTNTTDTDHIDWYQVGEVKTTEVDKDLEKSTSTTAVFTATKKVEVEVENQEQPQTLATNNTVTVNVTGATEQTITEAAPVAASATALSDIKAEELNNIVKDVVAAADTSSVTFDNPTANVELNVKIEIVSDKPEVDTSNEAVPTITYEIHPEAVAYIADQYVGSTKIDNSQLADGASFNITLKVPDAVYNAATEHKVNIVHKKEDGKLQSYNNLTVQGTARAYYVTISGVTSFSEFELVPVVFTASGGGSHTFTLSLKDSIDINLYYYNLKAGTDASKYTVDATFYNRETSVTETNEFTLNEHAVIGADGWYKMTVASAAACQVADVVTITLKYDNQVVETYTYSVKQYCESACEKSNDSKLIELCKAVLDYGTMAQINFGYNTSNPANVKYSNWGVGQSTSILNSYSSSNAAGAPFGVLKTLTLKSKTEVNFYVEKLDKDYTFALNGVSASADVVGGYYKVKATGIAASKLDDTITLTVNYGGNDYVFTYSPLAYAYTAQKNTQSDELRNVCTALYLYNQAAEAYFNN